MWGVLLGVSLALHRVFPHPYVHATHAAWYLLRSGMEDTPHVRFGERNIARETKWFNLLALACVSCASAIPTPNLLDYTWTPYLVFVGNGYDLPAWLQILQGAFLAGYVHVRPEAVLACTVPLWKHAHASRNALAVAAAAHALLAFFEPNGEPTLLFLSILTAECKYRVTQSPCQHVFELWCTSLLAMGYELGLSVWSVPTLTSVVLGGWTSRWQYTDQLSAWGCVYLCVLWGTQRLL